MLSIAHRRIRCFILGIGFYSLLTTFGWCQSKLDFSRDVRPILAATCFRCHGFDANKREADLRLDTSEGMFGKRGDEPSVIVPGDAKASLVVERIFSNDPDIVMPPPSAQRQLNDNDKSTIRRWIEQGADYKKHWSFEPIADSKPPKNKAIPPSWKKSAIDRYLFDEMKRRDLSPQPEADRRTLIRRVAFTLTGLPPTLAEITEYEADEASGAYERMVDRYMSSMRYGEEMARHWLDVARYGDTHGLHLDNERQMWAYRDWVVNAFNENVSFTQFTIEQLAGDLLPSPTQSQLVATGFNRCNVTTSEGGAIADEFLHRYAVDRTSTVIQTWLGLTGGCAVCHDHKYDPLTTREFYSMYAFFYSAADPAMDGNTNTTAPFVSLPTAEQERELTRRKSIEASAKRSLLEVAEKTDPKKMSADVEKKHEGSEAVFDIWLDDELPMGATTRNTTRNAEKWTHSERFEVPMGLRALYQSFGNKFEQSVTGGLVTYWLPEDSWLHVWVRLDTVQPPQAIFVELKAGDTIKRFGWAASEEHSKLVGVDRELRMGELPMAGIWSRLSVDLAKYGFKVGAEVQEFKLGQFGGICWWDGLTCSGTKRAKEDLRADATAWIASRKGKTTPYADVKIAEALKKGPGSEIAKENAEAITAFYHAMIAVEPSPEVEEARRRWKQARIELEILESEIPGTFVFKDMPQPRQAHIMMRGQYDQKGDDVEPATPVFLPSLLLSGDVSSKHGDNPPKKRLDRLDLARWIVSDDHPLPARVTVNRFWQQVFGVGIVRTSDDFGTQGSMPTHPALLDHLALRFRNGGWNVKKLMKELLVTAAFRQASSAGPKEFTIDPENRYLARGPRIRLDAEQIRDNALAVSGLLDLSMGGPGAKTYQPPNIWEPVGYGDSNTRYYVQEHGNALYRRSLYCFLKRTAPPPFMSNFDAPNRELFCTRRERSNTPLQALQLMNDVQFFEAARKLAERILVEAGLLPEQRIRYAFQIALARMPDDFELDVAQRALGKFRTRIAEKSEDAKRMLRVGESPASSTLEPDELAAYTLLANLLLNLDECVVRN